MVTLGLKVNVWVRSSSKESKSSGERRRGAGAGEQETENRKCREQASVFECKRRVLNESTSQSEISKSCSQTETVHITEKHATVVELRPLLSWLQRSYLTHAPNGWRITGDRVPVTNQSRLGFLGSGSIDAMMRQMCILNIKTSSSSRNPKFKWSTCK